MGGGFKIGFVDFEVVARLPLRGDVDIEKKNDYKYENSDYRILHVTIFLVLRND
jgi:hypothetical protein